MFLSRGFWRNTCVDCKKVRRITPEIIECDCPECGGTGDWTRFLPEPQDERCPCVDCKGTGRVYA